MYCIGGGQALIREKMKVCIRDREVYSRGGVGEAHANSQLCLITNHF